MTQLRKPSALLKPELYGLLKAMYDSNNLYSLKTKEAIVDSEFLEALKPLRTVVNRSVEFFVAKVFPTDKMKPAAENINIIEPIEQIATWSNFSGKKQLYLRNLAMFGDLFLKVNVDSDKAFYESINPMFVTDFEADSRGFLQWIRIDIPVNEKSEVDSGGKFDDSALPDRGNKSHLTYTEYWSKTYFSIWIHGQGATAALDQLGDPRDFGFIAEFGIDFVPFVHIKFRDTGDKHGKAAVEHAIDKIDEANREATRLAQILFRYNKALWAVTSTGLDKDGLPLPPPKIKQIDSVVGSDVTLTDNSLISLPGMSKMESLIPNINYDAALAILNAMMLEIEQDLPELKYYSLKEGDLSGKAIALLLGGALDRALEARNNFMQGLTRANEIALTMGRNVGLFTGIGEFGEGDFEHTLFVDSVFSDSLDDRVTILKTLVESGVPLKFAMKQVGFTAEEIAEMQSEQDLNFLDLSGGLGTVPASV